MKHLTANDFVCLCHLQDDHGFVTDVAYARYDNQLFGEPVYHAEAKIWAYKDIADIVIRAAHDARNNHGLTLIVYDCLRTTTAQARMMETQRVKDNPHWVDAETRLLSPPGTGAHPRGMAVDVSLMDSRGIILDMGTPFDMMSPDSAPAHNPAHRDHPHLAPSVIAKRAILDKIMKQAAKECGHTLMPLPQEWWDFRFTADVYEQFAPLADDDLPGIMRCCG